MNPVLNVLELHNGIDIAAKIGTEVLAVTDGEIIEVRESSSYGNLVKYKTNDGYTIMYAHLDKTPVKVGQAIKAGDCIAYSGNTGLTTGPHLHYTIWKNGELVNPKKFIVSK